MTATRASAIADIDWGVIEGDNTEFAAKYPRFQWVHGSKQAAGFMKTGGLFVSEEEFPNFSGEGFDPAVLITREGDEKPGFAAAKAKLAVIRVKHQWVKDETYGRNVPLAHVLCVVKGTDDLVYISLKGANKALEFQKAFNQHLGQNVSLANKTRPQGSPALEPFALWFPVEVCSQVAAQSKDGKASSPVTPPVMSKPETLDRNYVVSLWVGSENYKSFVGYYRETEAWQKAPIWEQRTDDDTPTHTGETFRVSDAQIEFLNDMCVMKDIVLRELVASVMKGETDNITTLTFDEAHNVIEAAKAY